MNDFFAKLTNLSYEIFGVFLPGMVTNIFLFVLWASLGGFAPFLTSGAIPVFELDTVKLLIDSLNLASGIGAGLPLIAIWYFLGHIILWIGRSGKPMEGTRSKGTIFELKRLFLLLTFRIPKAKDSFNPKLENIFKLAKKKFEVDNNEIEWRQFYPIAKIFLSQRLSTSLVTTYQNKYTFHRSVVTICTVFFWITFFSLITARFFLSTPLESQPYWWALIVILISTLVFIWNFSSSYLFHWEMFGNTIITETYSILFSPKDAPPPK